MGNENGNFIYFDRSKRKFMGIDAFTKKHLKSIYKDIDIETEFNKMALWLMSSRGLDRAGDINFITGWLNRATPCVHDVQCDPLAENSPLAPAYLGYLEDLWKNRETLFQFNTMKMAS
jgi:hypothetical protein